MSLFALRICFEQVNDAVIKQHNTCFQFVIEALVRPCNFYRTHVFVTFGSPNFNFYNFIAHSAFWNR